MPAICARSSARPGCSVSSTEALGFCCSRKKPFWFGSARWTRAACTAGERADRARQLALEAALEGEPLLELGLAEAGAVHQLEARDRALRQAGGRHLQAQVVHLRRRNEDRRAAFGHAVRHVHLRAAGR